MGGTLLITDDDCKCVNQYIKAHNYSELSLCSFISAATIEIEVDGVVSESEDANVS